MINKVHTDSSLSDVHQSVDTTRKVIGWKKILSFFGPAYLISVGYMDPGNWATDLAGGSKYGYALIWVLLMSNFMALLLQGLSARLGIVRGRDLAQANRETYPKYLNIGLYVLAEVAIVACDLAEVLGMAIGIQLLTGLPLVWGVTITVLDTFLLLYLQKLGMRRMEAFIIGLIAIIGICFLVNIILAQPHLHEVLKGFIPTLPDAKELYARQGILAKLPSETAIYLAVAIIGATVMPHNLYLHSALVQTRKIDRTERGIRQALKYNAVDSTIALNIAFFVNVAILVLAATVFFKTGQTQVAEIKDAHALLAPLLGSTLAPKLFAVALIAAGQSSTITGTLAGQIIMEGYLSLRINPLLRRLLTRLLAIIPALLVIIIYGEEHVQALLVLSQVILSLQLGFAIIPLIHFVSDKKTMGSFVIGPVTKIASWLVASVLIFLNLKMLMDESADIFKHDSLWPKLLVIAGGIIFVGLLIYIILFPLLSRIRKAASIQMHPPVEPIGDITIPVFSKIAVALDFSVYDEKLLGYAIGQGNKDTTYVLLHIVESASAKLLGRNSDDFETRKDAEQMNFYITQLEKRGLHAIGQLGFQNRIREIVRLVKENDAEMLVIGAHGHTGLKDFIYGQTVNAVRHELKIPVLVVNL